MDILSNPHDRLFKAFWSDPEIVQSFLNNYLPADMMARVNTQQLEIMKDSFIENHLKEFYSDMLYRLTLDGTEGFVYVLFEHKSNFYTYTAFQLLEYMVKIWRLYLKQEGMPLPVILPIVIYHGQAKWTKSHDFASICSSAQKTFADHIPNFKYLLYDLSAYSDEEIKGTVLLRILFLLFKYIRRPDFSERLPSILSLFRDLLEKETGIQYLETVMRYLVAASEVPLEKLRSVVQSNFSGKGDTTIMTTGERIFNDGLQQGLQQGFQQGLQEGLQQGLQQGFQQGLQEGLQQGIHQVSLELIESLLCIKFGSNGLKLLPAVLKITDTGKLRAIKEAVKMARDISEVEIVLN